MGLGEAFDLPGLLFGLELLVAIADRVLVEAFTFGERADILGDLIPLIEELGVGLDQADELLAADLDFLGVLTRIPLGIIY